MAKRPFREVKHEGEGASAQPPRVSYQGARSVVSAARSDVEAMSTSSSNSGSAAGSRRSSISDPKHSTTMQAFGRDGRSDIEGFRPSGAYPPLKPVNASSSQNRIVRPQSSSGLEERLLSAMDDKLKPLVEQQKVQSYQLSEVLRGQELNAVQITLAKQARESHVNEQRAAISALEGAQEHQKSLISSIEKAQAEQLTQIQKAQEEVKDLDEAHKAQISELSSLRGEVRGFDGKMNAALEAQVEKVDEMLENSRKTTIEGVQDITSKQSERISVAHSDIVNLRSDLEETEQVLRSELLQVKSDANSALEASATSLRASFAASNKAMEGRIDENAEKLQGMNRVCDSLSQKVDSNTLVVESFKSELQDKIEAVKTELEANQQEKFEELSNIFDDKIQELQSKLETARSRLESGEADHASTKSFILEALVGLKGHLVANTVELTAFRDAYSDADKKGLEYFLKEKMYTGLKEAVNQILPNFVDTVEELRATAEANLDIYRSTVDPDMAAILHEEDLFDEGDEEAYKEEESANGQYSELSVEGDFVPQETIEVEPLGLD